MRRRGKFLLYNIDNIFLLLFIYFLSPYLYASHDNSLRIDQNFYGTINDQFQVQSYIFHQINKKISDYNYMEFGTGLQYKTPLTWLAFLIYYQQSYSQGDDKSWLIERKPSINMNTSVVISYFKIFDQIRYEYRVTPAWNDYRIKNYLEVSLYDIFLQPCIGWEIYYEDHDKDIMLNRIKFGIITNVYGSIYLGSYYRIDFSKINNQWEFSRQLIGFSITLKY